MRTLNYKHLRYFWAVAKSGSIMKAAHQLHLTPQSISGQLTEFADVLGVELFRRVGRRLELTDAGRQVLGYAEEIFSIGEDLMQSLQGQQNVKVSPLLVGIADSVPKSVAYRLLEPTLKLTEPFRLICREGRLLNLLAELSVHKLDLIIADRPIPPHLHVRGFNHLLGESSLTIFGSKELANTYPGKFPARLKNAPFLLPGEDSAIRTGIEHWLEKFHLNSRIAGEFDDSALLKSFAQAGVGFFAAPTATAKQISKQYDLVKLGEMQGVNEQIFLITTERRITHPAVMEISKVGREDIFG